MIKYTSTIAIITLLFITPITGCYCTQHFHNLTIHKTDSFDWKAHDHNIPDFVYIEPEAMTNVSMKRWGYTVKFIADTDDASINYTLTNHKWQNRKMKLYITGTRRQILYADDNGTVSFAHIHRASDPLLYRLKPACSWKDLIAWFTSI